jgi:phospholipid/cholesterol/gamma-HCH transport system substrate-binding protein
MPESPSAAMTRDQEEGEDISPHGSSSDRPGRGPGGPEPISRITRLAAIGALALALVVVAVIVLEGGGSYTLQADFQDASGLVSGDEVLIGPAQAGTVSSIGLTPDGHAQVTMSLDNDVAPLHQGTVARIYEDSLSGIADKYVELEPGPGANADIQDGGTLPVTSTYSEVNIDELFDTFDPLTRAGLSQVIRGEAASLRDRGAAANRTLDYLDPGLQSASDVTAELTRDEPAFDGLVVQGARALETLASRGQQLSQLIANTDSATGAIARRSQALQETLTLLPSNLSRSATTFAGLRTTLDRLDPLVAASKPAVRRLPELATRLGPLLTTAIPTVAALDALIHNPSGAGDLTMLARQTPALARTAAPAFTDLVAQLNDSQAQLDYLREYTPDVVAALTNVGQASAYYDANGHYLRAMPELFAFALTSSHQLTTQFPAQRYAGLQTARSRCPGAAVQPTPDGSAPHAVPGSTSSVPSGP